MKKHRLFGPAWASVVMGLAVACIAATSVGGFQLRVEVPQGNRDAVLLVRTYRCHQPEKARVTGMAEGLVKGKRVSLPIQLETVDKGVYAVAQQWPTEGAWVLTFSGSYDGLHVSTLVALDAGGKVAMRTTDAGTELDVQMLPRALSSSDVTHVLERISSS